MTDVCPADGAEVRRALTEAARQRILVLDGAMGTELQAYKFSEEDFRGDRFRNHGRELRGNE